MIRLLLPAALALCFVCCDRQTDCPSFPEDFREWMPYYNNEQAVFGAGTERQTFTFNDVFATPQYTISSTEACDCDASAHAYSTVDSVNNLQLLCSAEKQKIRHKFVFEFQHYGMLSSYYVPVAVDRFIFSFNNNGSLEGSSLCDSVMIGGQRFDNVLVVENDLRIHEKADIYKIYLVKGKGIVRYDRRSGQNFTLTDL